MPSERSEREEKLGVTKLLRPFIVYCTATTPVVPYMNLSLYICSFLYPFLFFLSTLVLLLHLMHLSLPILPDSPSPFLTPVLPLSLPPSLPPPLSLSLRELKVPERGVLGFLCCCCWKKP